MAKVLHGILISWDFAKRNLNFLSIFRFTTIGSARVKGARIIIINIIITRSDNSANTQYWLLNLLLVTLLSDTIVSSLYQKQLLVSTNIAWRRKKPLTCLLWTTPKFENNRLEINPFRFFPDKVKRFVLTNSANLNLLTPLPYNLTHPMRSIQCLSFTLYFTYI